jgi:hypothetical protein
MSSLVKHEGTKMKKEMKGIDGLSGLPEDPEHGNQDLV